MSRRRNYLAPPAGEAAPGSDRKKPSRPGTASSEIEDLMAVRAEIFPFISFGALRKRVETDDDLKVFAAGLGKLDAAVAPGAFEKAVGVKLGDITRDAETCRKFLDNGDMRSLLRVFTGQVLEVGRAVIRSNRARSLKHNVIK